MAAAVTATGCSWKDSAGPWSSADARINAAFPVAEAVRHNQAWLLEATTGERRKALAEKLQGRLKLRALNCAVGYAPSWLASADDIRKKLGNTSCFTEADAELGRWTGLLRAGVLLSRPALKAPSAAAPPPIVAEGFISSASFAAQAPLALLDVGPGQRIQVVDMQSSRPLYTEGSASTTARAGQLAPNGRVFTAVGSERLRILETETGTVIVDAPVAAFHNFHWLDARTAVVNRMAGNTEKPHLIDFDSGKEVVVPWATSRMQRAVPAPGTDNQYVIFTDNAITKVSLDRSGVEPAVALVADKQAKGRWWAPNNSGLTADNARFFGTSQRELHIVDLATLEVQTVAFEPFQLQVPFATPDPDKILLTGVGEPAQGESRRTLLYSISRGTVAPLDAARYPSTRFLHIPVLKKQAVITERKIEMLDELALQPEVPLAQFVAQMVDLANQRKLAAFENAQSGGLSMQQGGFPGIGGLPQMGMALARDAQVEAIGVYQGDRRTGGVEVRVRRSGKPIVLVLASYEAVRWTVVPEPGARIAAVLLSGYNPSQVVGAGSARVIQSGRTYAYKMDGAEYQALHQEVVRMFGKGIGMFQGRYEGAQFSVGGT